MVKEAAKNQHWLEDILILPTKKKNVISRFATNVACRDATTFSIPLKLWWSSLSKQLHASMQCAMQSGKEEKAHRGIKGRN